MLNSLNFTNKLSSKNLNNKKQNKKSWQRLELRNIHLTTIKILAMAI
jgi:hypothetical protein